MNNIAVITARSGSKGIPDKNIKMLAGKPLMAYSIEAAIEAGIFNTIMVSTDSTDYAEIAKKFGAEVPFLRSEKTSGDTAGSWDVITEVLEKYDSLGKRFSTICLLQPTSPLRTAEDLIGSYRYMETKKADSVASVCECEHQMHDMMRLDEDFSLTEYRKNNPDVPRQMCPTYYRLNGAVFIRSIEYSNGRVVLKNDREFAYMMEQKNSIDIDTIDDFEYAEYLMNKRNG